MLQNGSTHIDCTNVSPEEVFLARINSGLVARGELVRPVLDAHNSATLVDCKVTQAFTSPIQPKRLAEFAASSEVHTLYLDRINVGGGALSASSAQECERIFGCEIYTDWEHRDCFNRLCPGASHGSPAGR